MTVSFKVTRREAALIVAIVDRTLALANQIECDQPDRTSLTMDLVACHANGCQLKLVELLAADTGDFAHDIWGIRRHIDRTTGKLTDCFLPRFAQ